MVEVCHGPYTIDNNLFLSKWAFKDMSSGAAFVHNLISGKFAPVRSLTGTRPTIFHITQMCMGLQYIKRR
jgi:hypothetical protein